MEGAGKDGADVVASKPPDRIVKHRSEGRTTAEFTVC